MQRTETTPMHVPEKTGENMGGHARQQWMVVVRELTDMMERFQLEPSDETFETLVRHLRAYKESAQKNEIQVPQTFKSF